MKHYVKLFSVLSTGTLLGCTQLSLAPTVGEPVAATGPRASVLSRVQPVERISSPVAEVEGLFIMGRVAHGAGQLALAEERYAQILKIQPLHLGALDSIAVLYAQTGRTDQALQFFNHALELDPKASHVHNNFGYALLRNGQLVEAERELRLAHDLNPSSSQTRKNIELLIRSKERVAVLAGLTGRTSGAEVASSGPQLVAIGPHVYELRDRPVALSEQPQPSVPAGPQPQIPTAEVAGNGVAQDQAISTSLRGVRIEVSNGVGIRYLARRTAERLAPMGVVTARLTNQAPYQQAKTEIQFGDGQKNAAYALSAKLPVAVSTVLSARLANNIQMRLVLGHDLAGKAVAAWLEADTDTNVAMADDDGWRWS